MGKRVIELTGREQRHRRVRRKVHGTPNRPRLTVFRSLNHIYAQVINDEAGHTLAYASSLELKDQKLDSISQASAVGEMVAGRAKEAGITQVVFDRGGYKYHGRVAALADGARKGTLEF